MTVSVQLMGQLRDMLPPADLRFDLPPTSTVYDALQAIAARSAVARLQFFTEQGAIRPSLLLAVNDQALAAGQAAAVILQDRDQLIILPPISGG